MAKTWTVNEAYNAIKANDVNGIADFGKRFPLATTALARSGVNDGLDVLMGAMPDRVTMRILEMQLKEGVSEVADDDEETAEVENPVKAEKKEKKAVKAEKTEKKSEDKPKRGRAAKKVEKDVEDDDVENETENDTPDYKSMSAPELFKLCKKRGIKVEPKQKSAVYIKALEAADNGSDDADSDDDSDWDI